MKINRADTPVLFPACWDTLGIAAPSSMPDKKETVQAMDFLASLGMGLVHGYSPEEKDTLSYLSASPRARLQHLNDLICDPRVRAIYCLRGGFGSIQLLDGIDFQTLAERKLPLIGYSDITALHMAMLRKKAGIPISACMALHLEEDAFADPLFCSRFHRAMTLAAHKQGLLSAGAGRFSFREVSKLQPMNDKAASPLEGKVICGNMTVMTSLCGTDFFPSFHNRIVILEEIGEPPRRIDAYLNQLRLNHVFTHCKAVILGSFTSCPDQKGDLPVMLERFAATLPCPVYGKLHFGHCRQSISFMQEETVRIRDNKIYCRFLQEI